MKLRFSYILAGVGDSLIGRLAIYRFNTPATYVILTVLAVMLIAAGSFRRPA